MIRDGFYKLFALNWGADGKRSQRLLSRFMIQKGNIRHLEDHFGTMPNMLPEGPITYNTLDRLKSLETSAYFHLIHEDDVNEGHHPEHIEPMDLGLTEPEQRFALNMNGKFYALEVWPEVVTMDGHKLSDQQLAEIMDKVKEGAYTLTVEE